MKIAIARCTQCGALFRTDEVMHDGSVTPVPPVNVLLYSCNIQYGQDRDDRCGGSVITLGSITVDQG